MSCFWDGLRNKVPELRGKKPKDLIQYFKEMNRLTTDVCWQSQRLRMSEIRENYKTVEEYVQQDGHLTSSSDPFLLLVSQLYGYTIEFNFAGNRICITNPSHTQQQVLQFSSSKSHFT